MTNTDICNLALSNIGKGQIQDINESSEMARQCKLQYDHVRKLMLRDHNWGFAKRVIRAALLDAAYPGWKFVYAYPEQCMAIRYIYNERGVKLKTFKKKDYESFLVSDSIQAIGCDVEEAWFEYTYDVKDADMFPADFSDALAHRLASAVALSLTNNDGLKQQEFQLYQLSVHNAMVLTNNENHEETKYPDKYMKARMK